MKTTQQPLVVPEQRENNLSHFFKEEYQALKGYVRSKIEHTSESDAEDIIQDVALRIFSRPQNPYQLQILVVLFTMR